MKDLLVSASPLQIGRIFFERVVVEAEEPDEPCDEWLRQDFDFTGVKHHIVVNLGTKTENPDEEDEFLLRVDYRIKNESGKKAPYKIDVSAGTVIRTISGFGHDNRVDLVRVNGASILYGAIREMVANITSRLIYGELWLPTLRFIPSDKGNLTTEQVASPPEKE